MNERQLRQLGRTELLEMLLECGKENEQLQARVQEMETAHQAQIRELEDRLQDRAIHLDNVGSIAEAALALNGVFEAAEASCIQYIENIRRINQQQAEISREREAKSRAECAQLVSEAQERCAKMEQETRAKCDAMLRDAEERVEEKWSQISRRLSTLYSGSGGSAGLGEQVGRSVSFVSEKSTERG